MRLRSLSDMKQASFNSVSPVANKVLDRTLPLGSTTLPCTCASSVEIGDGCPLLLTCFLCFSVYCQFSTLLLTLWCVLVWLVWLLVLLVWCGRYVSGHCHGCLWVIILRQVAARARQRPPVQQARPQRSKLLRWVHRASAAICGGSILNHRW